MIEKLSSTSLSQRQWILE